MTDEAKETVLAALKVYRGTDPAQVRAYYQATKIDELQDVADFLARIEQRAARVDRAIAEIERS